MNSLDKSLDKIYELLTRNGKHTIYQKFPSSFLKLADEKLKELVLNTNKTDSARYDWLISNLGGFIPKTITDIGANTGYFALELHDRYNSKVSVYEPHVPHALAIAEISKVCGCSNSFTIHEKGVSLSDIDSLEQSDLIVFLNVLHHAGDDFDRGLVKSLDEWYNYAEKYLNKLSHKSNFLFFQLGNAWMGGADNIYSDNDYFASTVKLLEESKWEIFACGYIDNISKEIEYVNVDLQKNILKTQKRSSFQLHVDKLTRYVKSKVNKSVDYKFSDRPIFLCKSKNTQF